MSKCSEIISLKDFGLKIGSLNDTQKEQDMDKVDLDNDNEIHRGSGEVEIEQSKPMFFKIPY